VWHAHPEERSLTRQIAAITDVLMAVVKAPTDRRWNPYAEVMARSEFRKRLEAASRGELVPVDHVKSIEHPLAAEMFEIRWQDINVTKVDDHGGMRFDTVHVRLLHAEPGCLGVTALALRAHEKLIVPDDSRATREAQDAEIAGATLVLEKALPEWLKSPARDLIRDTHSS
jgi:hypothetical protein